MSSALRVDMDRTRRLLSSMPANSRGLGQASETSQPANERIKRLGLTPRQQELNDAWSWYRCERYAARRLDWNGKQNTDPVETEAIASAGFMPAGFYDAGQTLPIKFRKPTAPYSLIKVIVDRFTGLLFSERHHPQIHVEGNQPADDYLTALATAARLWPAMIKARTFGGAMGSVAIGFQFVDGKPHIEVHDPRWTLPTFSDRASLKLSRVEKRYIYTEDVPAPNGGFEQKEFWYRRIIDETSDTLYHPADVGDGDEPVWRIKSKVDHNLGFCPVIWVQNLPVDDEIDGDSDCMGIYDMAHAIDMLLAQANKGVLANCDPTAVISTDAEMSEVRKGSDNAIKLPQGGSADYMEISGTGPEAAVKLAKVFREMALEVAQCVLDQQSDQQKTATEIERTFSAMIAKADVMREQYGEKAVKPLLQMMLSAIHILKKGTKQPDGTIVMSKVELPPRAVKGEDGSVTYKKLEVPESETTIIELQWPRYFDPVLTDVELAARAAIAAKAGGLIDKRHAVKYVAEYFEIEDVDGIIESIDAERQEEMQIQEQATIRAMQAQSAGDSQGLPDGEGDDADVSGMDNLADLAGGGSGESGDHPVEGAAPVGEDVQKQVLNGAQFESMASIVAQVANRELPRESGVAMLMYGLRCDQATAEAIMGPAGKTFFVQAPEEKPPVALEKPMPSDTGKRPEPKLLKEKKDE